jgi:thiosulfate/3-mercaptopyruvate sulfurtransferase
MVLKMKRFATLLLMVLLSVTLLLSGCTPAANPETTDPKASETPSFTGKYIVTADYVKENLKNENILLVDARGEETAKAGTIEGAMAMTWQLIANMAPKKGEPMWATIQEPEVLSQSLTNLGLTKDKEIILFAAGKNGWGDDGRIAWELISAGFENVKMVDGGYDALVVAGLPIARGGAAPTPAATPVIVESIDMTRVINTEELKANYSSYKILDTRAPKEYNGGAYYGEAKGGRLPKSINIDFVNLFNSENKLKSNEEISTMLNDAGFNKDDQIITYCTTGIRSAYFQLILEMCGFNNVKNYDESYNRWCVAEEVEN